MPYWNVVSWTAMIFGCAQMEEGDEVLQQYACMQNDGVTPNDHTFVGASSENKGLNSKGMHQQRECCGLTTSCNLHLHKSSLEFGWLIQLRTLNSYSCLQTVQLQPLLQQGFVLCPMGVGVIESSFTGDHPIQQKLWQNYFIGLSSGAEASSSIQALQIFYRRLTRRHFG